MVCCVNALFIHHKERLISPPIIPGNTQLIHAILGRKKYDVSRICNDKWCVIAMSVTGNINTEQMTCWGGSNKLAIKEM